MTHDEMIAVIAAHRDGKTIQYMWTDELENGWKDFDPGTGPAWNFKGCDYRIKPEPPKPREWWISLRDNTTVHNPAYWNYLSARSHMLTSEVIHVREVLPDAQA